jgi:hypothetical protein
VVTDFDAGERQDAMPMANEGVWSDGYDHAVDREGIGTNGRHESHDARVVPAAGAVIVIIIVTAPAGAAMVIAPAAGAAVVVARIVSSAIVVTAAIAIVVSAMSAAIARAAPKRFETGCIAGRRAGGAVGG